MFKENQALLNYLHKIQKHLSIILIVLPLFISSPSWSENNNFPEIISEKAIEIMTEGVLLSMEFSQQDIGDTSFLKWRALVKFGGRIYSCSIDQMIGAFDVSDPPFTRCRESV
jgi:hypothetical protein